MKVIFKFTLGLLLIISPSVFAEKKKAPVPTVKNAWGNLYGFHQSRAHYRSGKTYLTWVGPDNHPYVSDYDHRKDMESSARGHKRSHRMTTTAIRLFNRQRRVLACVLWRPQQAYAVQ